MTTLTAEQDALAALESHLKDLTQLRDQMQIKFKDSQKELQKLTDKKMERPRESLEGLEEKIVQLERDRTIQSMTLKEEKAILKDIYKAERTKRTVQDFQAHDERIKAKKARVVEMRNSLQVMRQDIDTLRAEVALTKTAVQVGCSKESLLGMKLACPTDKLGDVIGKKGSNVKQLMEKASVRVDIVDNNIRLFGAMEGLDAAAVDIGKVIEAKEEEFDLQPALASYLSGRNIKELEVLQTNHPNVYIRLPRKQAKIVLRGTLTDIAHVKEDLLGLKIIEKAFEMSNPEAAYVIGKGGQTIERLTEQHQVVIKVSDKKDEGSTITLTGLEKNVTVALEDILELTADAREGAETVKITSAAKVVLLKNHGVAMKGLYKEASKVAREAGGMVNLRIDGFSVIVRATAKVLEAAKVLVLAEIQKIEDSVVRMSIDKSIVPKIIGKGGETLKQITEGTAVDVEFDKSGGCLAIIGTDKEAIAKVKSSIEAIVGQNQVHRVGVDASVYKRQLASLLRSTIAEEIKALPCSIRGDNDEHVIILRGETDKINSAAALVAEFLLANHMEELTVTIDDLRLLARGGRDSKLAEFEAEHNVTVTSNWKDCVIYVRGLLEKVNSAVKAINTFLFGGDDWQVIKIPLEDRSLAVIIGKGGKNMTSLRNTYKEVSIIVKADNSLVLRGPSGLAEKCRVEILKRVYAAQITQEMDVTGENLSKLKKGRFVRDTMRDLPVSITFDDGIVSVRGVASDVDHVIAMLNEHLYGFYESRMTLESALFNKIKDAVDKSTVMDKLKNASGAFVAVSAAEESLVLRGKREQVKAAKMELLCLFDFLLKPAFEHLLLPGPLMYNLGKDVSIGEISAASGASVVVDRDITSALVFSSDPAKVSTAVDMLNVKIDEASKSFFEIELDRTEMWIAPMLIGSKGSRINALRKETRCTIFVDTTEGLVTVVSKDGDDCLEAARATIEAAIAEERDKVARVKVPTKDVSYFIGQKGQTIKNFRMNYAVAVEIVENDTIVLKGSPEAVCTAKRAVEDFIASREAARDLAKKEQDEAVSLHLRKDQVPSIIGAKGEVINALVAEFAVKIDIDRNLSIVTIRRGDEEKRKACTAKIREILHSIAEEAELDTKSSDDVEKAKPKRLAQRQTGRPNQASDFVPAQVKRQPSIETAYFPPLVDTPDRSVVTSSTSDTTPGRSWAHLATKEHPEDDHPPLEEIEAPPEVIRTH